MIFILPEKVEFFPHPLLANEDGLLAVGGQIDVPTLLLAYQCGIFPWYSEDDPLCWWFTHPRMVLLPDDLKIQKSMRPYLNNDKFDCTFDTAFDEVIYKCQNNKRKGQEGTWITADLVEAFSELHKLGYAHSVEVRMDGILVGGLYGLAIGKMFFGESMFATVSNASKFGFIQLVKFLQMKKFKLLDCQQETPHLRSLGAKTISGEAFLDHLRENSFEITKREKWKFEKMEIL